MTSVIGLKNQNECMTEMNCKVELDFSKLKYVEIDLC